MVYFLTLLVWIIYAHATQSYLSTGILGLVYCLVGTLAYHKLKTGFIKLDWLKIKPVDMSQIGVSNPY